MLEGAGLAQSPLEVRVPLGAFNAQSYHASKWNYWDVEFLGQVHPICVGSVPEIPHTSRIFQRQSFRVTVFFGTRRQISGRKRRKAVLMTGTNPRRVTAQKNPQSGLSRLVAQF